MKGSLVPVFLQDLLLAFRLLITGTFGILWIFFESLFLGQCMSSLNLLLFDFSLSFGLLVTLNTRQLSYPPCPEFALGAKTTGAVNVWNFSFLLLYSQIGYSERDVDGVDWLGVLSKSSRLIVSATMLWLCCRRSSASCSFFLIASSVS